MKDLLFHGECVCRQIDKLPEDMQKVEPKNGYVVVALSEVTGNDHRVEVNNGVQFYEKDGVLYAKVEQPTKIECVLKERHDSIPIMPGYWEFKKAVETDPFSQEVRHVFD